MTGTSDIEHDFVWCLGRHSQKPRLFAGPRAHACSGCATLLCLGPLLLSGCICTPLLSLLRSLHHCSLSDPLNWSPLYSVMSPISLHDVKLKAAMLCVLFRSWLCITTFPAPYSVCRLTARSQSLVGLPRHHPWRFHFSVLRKSLPSRSFSNRPPPLPPPLSPLCADAHF